MGDRVGNGTPINVERMAAAFRTLADPTRLRILGRLAEGTMTGAELGRALGLTAPTISHHMARLVEAGFVSVTEAGASRRYALDQRALAATTRTAGAREDERPTDGLAGTDGDTGPGTGEDAARGDVPGAESRADSSADKVLRDFFDGDRLTTLPAKRKKRVIVLQRIVSQFRPGVDYPEREVNDTLRAIYADVATLRRELVDYGFMTRDNGVYRVATTLPPRGPTVSQEMPPDEHAWLRALIGNATDDALAPTSGAQPVAGDGAD